MPAVFRFLHPSFLRADLTPRCARASVSVRRNHATLNEANEMAKPETIPPHVAPVPDAAPAAATPAKKARKPTVPMTRAVAAGKVAAIVKKLSPEDAMK